MDEVFIFKENLKFEGLRIGIDKRLFGDFREFRRVLRVCNEVVILIVGRI